eukprot:760574-Hanusia_phi.AAC.1
MMYLADNLDALLALGVSHTNELEQVNALTHLRSWITRHPEYSQLCPPQEEIGSLRETYTLHNEVEGGREEEEACDVACRSHKSSLECWKRDLTTLSCTR